MKMLEEEQLSKVTGGDEPGIGDVIVDYKESQDGTVESYNIGPGEPHEQRAKDWCTANNKIYYNYRVIFRKTDVYNTQVLLDSLNH